MGLEGLGSKLGEGLSTAAFGEVEVSAVGLGAVVDFPGAVELCAAGPTVPDIHWWIGMVSHLFPLAIRGAGEMFISAYQAEA